jgi:hypothetical protein
MYRKKVYIDIHLKVKKFSVCIIVKYKILKEVLLFYYINPNKMHMLQSLFYLTLLYMFRALLSPIVTSTKQL